MIQTNHVSNEKVMIMMIKCIIKCKSMVNFVQRLNINKGIGTIQ